MTRPKRIPEDEDSSPRFRAAFRGALVGLGLAWCVAADSGPPPAVTEATITHGAVQWRLPENPDLGWIIQQSSDLVHWTSLGDPVKVAPRPGPGLALPFVQGQPQAFFRAELADRPARARLLQERWSRWKTAGLRSYEFEFRWSCYCVREYIQWVRITVEDERVVSVRRVADDQELPSESWSWYLTLDGLFAWLTEAFDRNAVRIEAAYDAGLGYPLSGYVDYDERMADEEKGFEVRLPSPPAALMLADAPAAWPGDPYAIETVRRSGDWLELAVAYSGGCVDPHGWEFTAVPGPSSSEGAREVELYLTHDARGDTCESYVHRRLTFSLSSLRAWWAAQNPVLGGPTATLRLVVRDPQARPPAPFAVLDYARDPAAFVPRREVITATSQAWHGGVFGSGHGVNYDLVLRFPPGWGDAIRVQALWIEDRRFTPEVTWGALPAGGGRIATLKANFRATPRLDPEHPDQVLGVDEFPPRDPQAPKYVGAALLVTEALGQIQEWSIPLLHALPPVSYP